MAKRNMFSSSSNPFMKEEAYRDSSRGVLDSDMTQAHLIDEKMTVSVMCFDEFAPQFAQ